MRSLAWMLAASVLGAQTQTPQGLVSPQGLTEKIVCAAHPEQSYALYLPAAYAPERPLPALYLLDARGRALAPIERFRQAAEERGWILISSYNSRSDTTGDPNTPALNAMWIETHAHLAIDRRRTYAGGFSGGGRAAVGLARASEGAIAGVIGCGAGFPDAQTRERLPFPFFGTVGNRDFNYYEMRQLDEELAKAKTRHRIALFPGEHDWPPEDLAREALEWLDLQAARDGAWGADAAALEVLYRADLARTRELESSGRMTEAARRFGEIAGDFEGLADTAEAKSRAVAFERDPAVQQALKEERRRDQRDRRTLESLFKTLRAASEGDLPPVARLVGELQIASLKKRAEDSSPAHADERLSAQRLLANLRVQTSYYLPNRFLDNGDSGRALLMLSVAEAIDPGNPRITYNRAAAHARAGQSGPALADLQRAVDQGFRAFDTLETDPDFSRLRESEAYRKWLAQARPRTDSPASP